MSRQCFGPKCVYGIVVMLESLGVKHHDVCDLLSDGTEEASIYRDKKRCGRMSTVC